jgi:hypothetical protein
MNKDYVIAKILDVRMEYEDNQEVVEAIDKILKKVEVEVISKPKKKSYVDSAMEQRDFNYYFKEGTDVTIDGKIPLPDGNSFYPVDLNSFVGKRGRVKRVNRGLHAFGQGTSYTMDIDFNGEVVRDVSGLYVIPYRVKRNEDR